MIELGEKYFDTGSLKNVTIHCTGADLFLKGCQKKYDLIIIDVFRDMIVPEELETEQFLSCMSDTLNVGGIVIFNKMIYSQVSKGKLMSLKKLYEKIFSNLESNNSYVYKQNFYCKEAGGRIDHH